MSIIQKPNILKGVPAQFTLNKVNLAQLSKVQQDSYFSEPLNWYRVNIIYKSSEGKQYEIVEFDATQESPVGTFLVSEKARNEFGIFKIKILDFDGGFIEILRPELTSPQDYDIVFLSGPQPSGLVNWDGQNVDNFNSSEWVISLGAAERVAGLTTTYLYSTTPVANDSSLTFKLNRDGNGVFLSSSPTQLAFNQGRFYSIRYIGNNGGWVQVLDQNSVVASNFGLSQGFDKIIKIEVFAAELKFYVGATLIGTIPRTESNTLYPAVGLTIADSVSPNGKITEATILPL